MHNVYNFSSVDSGKSRWSMIRPLILYSDFVLWYILRHCPFILSSLPIWSLHFLSLSFPCSASLLWCFPLFSFFSLLFQTAFMNRSCDLFFLLVYTLVPLGASACPFRCPFEWFHFKHCLESFCVARLLHMILYSVALYRIAYNLTATEVGFSWTAKKDKILEIQSQLKKFF